MNLPIPTTRTLAVATVAALVSFGTFAEKADAAVTINFQEVGGDVVASYSGSFNLTGLGFGGSTDPSVSFGLPALDTTFFRVGVGDTPLVDVFSGPISGPTSIGLPALTVPTISSGNFLGLVYDGAANQFLLLPIGYAGGVISGSSTWTGESLASMGLPPAGSYEWSWAGDSLFITTTAIPEPSTIALAGLGALTLLRRR